MSTFSTPRALGTARTSLGQALLFGLGLPAAIQAVAWSVLAANLHRLPPTVALHWGVTGTADRVGPVGRLIATDVAFSLVMLALGATMSIVLRHSQLSRRIAYGFATGVSTFAGGVALATSWVQFGLADGRLARVPDAGIVLALVVAIALGSGAALLAGRDEPRPASGRFPFDAARAQLAPGETAAWFGTATMSRGAMLFLAAALVPLTVTMIGLAAQAQSPWFVALLAIPIAAALALGTVWRVQIDSRGLHCTGLIGWPRLEIPAVEIVRADVVEVHALREWGGLGLRSNSKGDGIILRSGQALQVTRSGQGTLTVTVDDAKEAAALLNTMAERARLL